LDRNLKVLAPELAAARQEQNKAGQVAGAARALEQLKAAAAEQRHWSAHVESSEGALEAVEQRAQVAEDELRAKAEELWERERRCVEAEGEVGGLEADLEAAALRAAEAEAALEPRGRPETPTV
jgi:negative regulator of sigma E activity